MAYVREGRRRVMRKNMHRAARAAVCAAAALVLAAGLSQIALGGGRPL